MIEPMQPRLFDKACCFCTQYSRGRLDQGAIFARETYKESFLQFDIEVTSHIFEGGNLHAEIRLSSWPHLTGHV